MMQKFIFLGGFGSHVSLRYSTVDSELVMEKFSSVQFFTLNL